MIESDQSAAKALETPRRSLYSYFKRGIDLVLSTSLLLLLLPVGCLIAVGIKLSDGGKIFYTHQRVGRGGKTFNLYKFRSMVEARTARYEQTLPGDPAVTQVGHILRRLKIDELPQLWNVCRGDLSLVGPRPCLPDTLPEFGSRSAFRHSIRPGLTGLAQVNGNVYLSWPERLEYDCQYVEQLSLLLDLKILLKTGAIVVWGDKRGLQQ